MSTADLWGGKRADHYSIIQNAKSRMIRDIFEYQEGQGLHNPYEQECREQDAIKNGDIAAFKKSISEKYDGRIGILANDPLRHHKNVAIGNITLASRSAIKGGVSAEKSFSMADSLIRQIEDLDTIEEVDKFKRMAQKFYVEAVAEEKSANAVVAENPLIAKTKDYIFYHMHDAVQISDIAKELHVNADYLSHIFKEHEGVTIKRYILMEKIKRSRNLLQYSDYSIQDIAFYLGFCSQSHFSKIFTELEGKTPSQYRKKFARRTTWNVR